MRTAKTTAHFSKPNAAERRTPKIAYSRTWRGVARLNSPTGPGTVDSEERKNIRHMYARDMSHATLLCPESQERGFISKTQADARGSENSLNILSTELEISSLTLPAVRRMASNWSPWTCMHSILESETNRPSDTGRIVRPEASA